MATRTPDDVTKIRRFFSEPSSPRQRQYEALRAYFFEQSPSAEVAKRFGYSTGAFRVLCHTFRRDELPDFFAVGRPGPRTQPKKSAAVEKIVELRKRNYSIYEISQELKAQGTPLSATAGDSLDGWADACGPLVIATAREAGKSLCRQHFANVIKRVR